LQNKFKLFENKIPKAFFKIKSPPPPPPLSLSLSLSLSKKQAKPSPFQMGKKLMGSMPCFMGYHDYIFTIAYPPIFSYNLEVTPL
jgi:hypothetical protein